MNPNSLPLNEGHRELRRQRVVDERDRRRKSLPPFPFYVSNKASFNHFDFEHKPLMAPKGSLRQPSLQISSIRKGKLCNFNRNPVAQISHMRWWKNDEKLHRGKKNCEISEMNNSQQCFLTIFPQFWPNLTSTKQLVDQSRLNQIRKC